MLTFNKFCCCLKLETGGYLIGFGGIFASLLSILALLAYLCFALDDIVHYVHFRFRVLDDVKIPIVIIFIVFAVVCGVMLLNLWISISLVRGTEHQKYRNIKPYLAIQGCFIFLLILESIFSWKIAPIVATVIAVYFWVCIHSLYEKIKIEARIVSARLDLEIAK